MRSSALTRSAAAACVAAALAGCGGDAVDTNPLGYLARQDEPGYIPGARLEVSGTIVALENGCLMLDRDRDGAGVPWIVWPPGTVPGDEGADVHGVAFGPGDVVTGAGTVAVLADLPGGNDDDTYFGAQGHYCGADSAGVMVLDSLRHAAG
ncbi:hypothetical protein [Demequina gelatinilytica]|uniref:hypothetical protein n=1 Tax=Demequina gelatinilytica TaxID=1638980 RepID=UPI000785D7E2|nr:hypothetical protein [Demequina gelatinilytica]